MDLLVINIKDLNSETQRHYGSNHKLDSRYRFEFTDMNSAGVTSLLSDNRHHITLTTFGIQLCHTLHDTYFD